LTANYTNWPYQEESGGGSPHSKTLRAPAAAWTARSVLDCASPLALREANLNRSRIPGQEIGKPLLTTLEAW